MTLAGFNMVIWPLALIFIAWSVGMIFDKIILAKLHRLLERTRWTGDEILINALRGKIVYLFLFSGIYGASLTLTISGKYLKYLDLLHNLLQILTILLVTAIVSRIAVGFVNMYTQKESGFLPSVSIFTNLTRTLVFAIGILVALQSRGISITPILTALGVGGLAVALALQDTLSNLFSGLQMIATRQFKPGDYVRLNTGEEGFIADITWRSTTLRVLANNLIIIPNATLAKATITNFCQPEADVSFSVELCVAYYSDLERVEQIAVEVGRKVLNETSGGVSKFEPSVRFSGFGDSGIKFTVGLRVKRFADQFLVKHEFIKQISRRFQEAGIEIPSTTKSSGVKMLKD